MAATHMDAPGRDVAQVSSYIYGGLGGVILIMAGLLWWQGGRFERIRGDFTAYKAAQAQLVADATSAAHIKAQETERHNADTMAEIQGRLDGSIADGVRLALRMRNALANLHASAVPTIPGQSGADDSTGSAAAEEATRRTFAAFADYTAGCQRDDERFIALQTEVKPQL